MIDIYNSIIYISKSIIKTLVASLLIEIFKVYIFLNFFFLNRLHSKNGGPDVTAAYDECNKDTFLLFVIRKILLVLVIIYIIVYIVIKSILESIVKGYINLLNCFINIIPSLEDVNRYILL